MEDMAFPFCSYCFRLMSVFVLYSEGLYLFLVLPISLH
jgi:hypothetical protein